MRRSYSEERGRSIRQMTGASSLSQRGAGVVVGRSIASGLIADDGTTLIAGGGPGGGAPSASVPPGDDDSPEEEAITLPRSTHSWLFTQSSRTLPFAFAAAVASLSYLCLVLALLNLVGGNDPGNRLGVPYQVEWTVRMAQYPALVIALIMEEEIPTGLYLLRMISKKSLHQRFPRMQFGRFVLAAIVRLLMGYLFLLNTFLVVCQATTVLEIFYDVLALQFLQQLDDIAFNLAKIDVFGKTLKRAALSKCFRAAFEKQPFALRKRMNVFLRAVYFLNLLALLGGMAFVTFKQQMGDFHSDSITVAFGDQIWNDAIVKLPSGGEKTRILLFSFFNGQYRRNGTHDGRPVYTEQNKNDGSPYEKTIGAEIKYCEGEAAWGESLRFVGNHLLQVTPQNLSIRCGSIYPCQHKEVEPFRRETNEYNLLDVRGDWTIWTGSLQRNGQVVVRDNECRGKVDCNYRGACIDGKCVCKGGNFGMHCEHKEPCDVITGGEIGVWWQVKWPVEGALRVYERPLYRYVRGMPEAAREELGFNPIEDNIYMAFTGSRWLGLWFRGTRVIALPRAYWRGYVQEYHGFWQNIYTELTLFVSDPTTQSSIIGVDFYQLGKQGEEFGPFGQLYPLSKPKGSGFMQCVDNEIDIYPWDFTFLDVALDFSDGGSGAIVIDYELKVGREFETEMFAKDCVGPVLNIDLNLRPVRMPEYDTHDALSLIYKFNKSQLAASNIWNAATNVIEVCHFLRTVLPAVHSDPKVVFEERFQPMRLLLTTPLN